MLADDEEPQLRGDAQQKTLEAEVAIGHPQRVFLDQIEDGIDQGSLLCMTVLAQDDIGHQLIGRFEDAQRLPRQGSGAVVPCLAKAVFAGSDIVAIENMHLVAGNRLWQGTANLLDKGLKLPSRMSDELGGYLGFDALEFVVQRGKRNRDAEGFVQEGGANRRESRSDDLPHQIDDRRKGQLACVLAVGVFLEQGI